MAVSFLLRVLVFDLSDVVSSLFAAMARSTTVCASSETTSDSRRELSDGMRLVDSAGDAGTVRANAEYSPRSEALSFGVWPSRAVLLVMALGYSGAHPRDRPRSLLSISTYSTFKNS